ncbi:LytTR family DNA-binding domain-containing protein [Mucilaginibacter sp. RS28]|uniref:LytTR family DNA-binding domain-containing protein n=1 Tax=Mucilaginibacter straminoryzae TaxID=2932774 RepID=A0A9X2BA42_9SPHI|nr:LytTR family DNA-binding domain-containing protein [Mucilaginibacter straminoryzae]MCJ8208397.1 LytTR family DNA-binding domain-containing protein [Mucilaginibacter straminoryzae]
MEQRLNCLIIDDDKEVNACVSDMVKQTPFLHLSGCFFDTAEALDILEKGGIDLLILDINLPGIDGVTFASTLKNSGVSAPKVILISGSREYAVDGYKVDALDYLVKPFTYEDFYKAAIKARSALSNKKTAPAADFLFLKVEHELVRVDIADICYLESFKDYVKVFTASKTITTLSTLKAMEEKLRDHGFLRIHRSFIINPAKVESIQHMTVKFGKTTIPVTEQYRDDFRREFAAWL